jgi:hypothetical protein
VRPDPRGTVGERYGSATPGDLERLGVATAGSASAPGGRAQGDRSQQIMRQGISQGHRPDLHQAS